MIEFFLSYEQFWGTQVVKVERNGENQPSITIFGFRFAFKRCFIKLLRSLCSRSFFIKIFALASLLHFFKILRSLPLRFFQKYFVLA